MDKRSDKKTLECDQMLDDSSAVHSESELTGQ